jgi:hypothetical protein
VAFVMRLRFVAFVVFRGSVVLVSALALLGGGPTAVALAASPPSAPVSSAAVSAAVSSAQASAAAADQANRAGAGSGGASALGGGSTGPLSPGLPQNATTSTATSAAPLLQTTTTAGDSGLSGGTAAAIGIGALAVLAAISFFIWYDARRRAPVRARAAAADGDPRGKKRPVKQRKLSPAERRRRKRGRAR